MAISAQVSTDELYHLVMAAHYLDVPGLLGLCTDAMADHIRGKSPSQVRACFGLKPNLSPEEVGCSHRKLLFGICRSIRQMQDPCQTSRTCRKGETVPDPSAGCLVLSF